MPRSCWVDAPTPLPCIQCRPGRVEPPRACRSQAARPGFTRWGGQSSECMHDGTRRLRRNGWQPGIAAGRAMAGRRVGGRRRAHATGRRRPQRHAGGQRSPARPVDAGRRRTGRTRARRALRRHLQPRLRAGAAHRARRGAGRGSGGRRLLPGLAAGLALRPCTRQGADLAAGHRAFAGPGRAAPRRALPPRKPGRRRGGRDHGRIAAGRRTAGPGAPPGRTAAGAAGAGRAAAPAGSTGLLPRPQPRRDRTAHQAAGIPPCPRKTSTRRP